MTVAQNQNKRTCQSGHEYRAWGSMVMVRVSASARPVPWGPASQFLLPHSTTLALPWFSWISVPSKCFLALQNTPNEIKQSGCQTHGCQLSPVLGVLGSPRTEVWIRCTFLVNSPHPLTVALSPPKPWSSHLVLGLLRTVHNERHKTALSLSPTKTSLPSPIAQVLPLTSTAYSVISCWDLSMVKWFLATTDIRISTHAIFILPISLKFVAVRRPYGPVQITLV